MKKYKYKILSFWRLYSKRKFSNHEIAKKLGVSYGSVMKWKKRFFPEGARWRYNAFVLLHENGYPKATIAFMLGCTQITANRFLQKYEKDKRAGTLPDLEELARIRTLKRQSALSFKKKLFAGKWSKKKD